MRRRVNTTATPLQHHAMTLAYQDHEMLIYDTVHRFIRQYGEMSGNFDDCLSRANELFVTIAFPDHNPERAEFTTYVRRVIWLGLISDLRRQADRWRRRPVSVVDFTESDASDNADPFWRTDFVDELSRDARICVKLALDVLEPSETPGEHKKAIRSTLRALGWKPDRVKQAFREVADVLEGHA